jgi:hypothetical protein
MGVTDGGQECDLDFEGLTKVPQNVYLGGCAN